MNIICRMLLMVAISAWSVSQVASCAHTAPVIATVKDCANQTTHAVALGILDDVSSILVCDVGNISSLPACVLAQLEALGEKAGWVAIDCVIAEIEEKATANARMSESPTEFLRARRAAAVATWRAGPSAGLGTAPARAP